MSHIGIASLCATMNAMPDLAEPRAAAVRTADRGRAQAAARPAAVRHRAKDRPEGGTAPSRTAPRLDRAGLSGGQFAALCHTVVSVLGQPHTLPGHQERRPSW